MRPLVFPTGPIRHVPLVAISALVAAFAAKPGVLYFAGAFALCWVFLKSVWELVLMAIGAVPATPRLRHTNQVGWYKSFCHLCRGRSFTSQGQFFYPQDLGNPLAAIIHRHRPLWMCARCKEKAVMQGYDPMPADYQEVPR